jgi:quaternary ammonium compound-resistance protein SugE
LGWLYLFIAGVIEVGFTTTIRYTDGFTKPLPTTLVLVLAGISFYFVARSTETIPLGIAYAVWGAIGAIGTVVVGTIYFGEPATFWRMFFLTMLIVSVVGLKLVSE